MAKPPKPPKPASQRALTILFRPSVTGGVMLKFNDKQKVKKGGKGRNVDEWTEDNCSTVGAAIETIGLKIAAFCEEVKNDTEAGPLFDAGSVQPTEKTAKKGKAKK